NFDKMGAGILTLTGASNNYTGTTTVSGGTLAISGSGLLPTTTVFNVSSAAGTFDISGISASSLTVGSLASVAGSSVALGAKNLASGGLNTNTTAAGVISGVGGSLTKNGTGALTLSGANTYTGGTTITSTGSVTVSNASGLGTGPVNIQTTHTGATVSLTVSGGINVANTINIDSTTGRAMIQGTVGSNTLSGPIVVTGAGANSIVIQNNGAAGTTFSLTNTLTSATYTNIFSLRGTSGAFGSISNTINAPSAVLQVNGDANWTVSGTGNNYSYTNLAGATGSFILGVTDALDTTGRIEWSTAATNTSRVDLAGFNQTVGGLTSPTTTATTHGVTNSGTSNSLLTLTGLSADRNFTGVISDGGTNKVAVTLNGAGFIQTFGGTVANTYTGDTIVTGGTLALAKTAGVNAVAGNLTVGDGTGTDVLKLQASNQIADTSLLSLVGTVNGSRGVFRLNGYSETLGGLSGNGVVEHNDTDTGVGSATSNLTLNVASGTQTQSAGGVIRNTGATSTGVLTLTKDGAGTQVLGGTNTYTGATTVTAGTLQVGSGGAGSTHASSAVSVNGNTAVLAGTGVINGATTVTLGQIRPGDSAGFSEGALAFSGGLTFNLAAPATAAMFDIQGTTTTNETGDVIHITGALTLDSDSNIIVTPGANWTPTKDQTWTLMDWTGLLTLNGWNPGTNLRNGSADTGTNFDLPDIASSGFVWDINALIDASSNGALVITIVPEPSRALLLVLGLGALVLRRRRSLRASSQPLG
ncbi:MAG: beta strand repeat-containing protein, partial [Roseimicrobium sp.]